MSFKKFVALFGGALFLFSLHTSCSSKNDLYEKVIKEKEKTAKSRHLRGADDADREKQIAIADACNEENTSCIEKCKNSDCEDACLKKLSTCEKDLPMDLKTIK